MDDIIFFRSGSSNVSDLRGLARHKPPIPAGVVAPRLSPAATQTLRLLLAHGGKAFVDSGAFSTKTPDFDRVFGIYESLAAAAPTPGQLYVVACDEVGSQSRTLELQRSHARRLRAFIDQGLELVVPLQRGALTPDQMIGETRDILGTDNFRTGIPSAKSAFSLQELSPLRCASPVPRKVHLLGMGMSNRRFPTVRKFLQSLGQMHLSCDSSRVTAMCGKKRPLWRHRREVYVETVNEFHCSDWGNSMALQIEARAQGLDISDPDFDDTEFSAESLQEALKEAEHFLKESFGGNARAEAIRMTAEPHLGVPGGDHTHGLALWSVRN